jgi:hypothetical protein
MEKLDLSKKYKTYYTAKLRPEVVEVEEGKFLSIDGVGDPSKPEFADKVQALYVLSFTLKFNYKEKGKDFVVPKLEGLWWFDEDKYEQVTVYNAPKVVDRNNWRYTLLIRVPDYVNEAAIAKAKEEVKQKKNLPLADRINFRKIKEGKSVQILHKGPFDKEPETLKKLASFMEVNNFRKNGHHHEIYLSDFRRTPPEKLKTILREPVR